MTNHFWTALGLSWLIGLVTTIRMPLYDACFNQRIDDPQVRVTMFPVRNTVDAMGEMGGGSAGGAIGNELSIRAALVASAVILSPVLPLYGFAMKRGD